MRAIIITAPGGPEVLQVQERPIPLVSPGMVLIEVKAFGVNQAEAYFRKGVWGDVAEISGIECVGVVKQDPSGTFEPGAKVMAMVGGLGRSMAGSYAKYVCAPLQNVVTIETELPWEDLAALPESYATAWAILHTVLNISSGQTLLVRAGTSALGQAAINIAAAGGVHVLATTRRTERFALLQRIGAQETLLEAPSLQEPIATSHPGGIDAVLDLVGTSTILDSLALLKVGGKACLAGFLGSNEPMTLQPVFQIPSGRHLSVFASAAVLGSPQFPLSGIPFQSIVQRAAKAIYQAKPARVFEFGDIVEAHRLLESGEAGGKIVVRVGRDE